MTPLVPPAPTVKDVLGTLIMWLAQSANAPISVTEAKTLLIRLQESPDV